MIPQEVGVILGILEDILGEKITITRYPLNKVPGPLWEGFVYDVQTELDVPGMMIAQVWNVWDLYEAILAERQKHEVSYETALPESTLIVHLDDTHMNSLLDDLEAVLEKYNMPYVMKLYTHKDGTLEKTPLLRASSDEQTFDDYHTKVMTMFQN